MQVYTVADCCYDSSFYIYGFLLWTLLQSSVVFEVFIGEELVIISLFFELVIFVCITIAVYYGLDIHIYDKVIFRRTFVLCQCVCGIIIYFTSEFIYWPTVLWTYIILNTTIILHMINGTLIVFPNNVRQYFTSSRQNFARCCNCVGSIPIYYMPVAQQVQLQEQPQQYV
jgi:hypothetical protein